MKHAALPTLFEIILKPTYVVHTMLFSLIYLTLAFCTANFSMIKSIVWLPYPFWLKVKILLYSLWGYWNSSNYLGTTTLMLIALLFGINMAFILYARRHRYPKFSRRFLFITTGLSLFTTGCAACGLPLLALIGITGSIAFLPFQGIELSALAIILLSASMMINIRSVFSACQLPQ